MQSTAEIPAYFLNMDHVADEVHLKDISPEPFAPTVPYIPPQKITRVATRIAQAKTGARELRLVSESEGGKHKHFLIESVVMWPYSTSKTALSVSRKRKQVPMTEEQANAAFDSEIASQFPPIVKNGKSIAIHTNLL